MTCRTSAIFKEFCAERVRQSTGNMVVLVQTVDGTQLMYRENAVQYSKHVVALQHRYLLRRGSYHSLLPSLLIIRMRTVQPHFMFSPSTDV